MILGAGPAGTAAAIVLARAGLRPLLLERNAVTGDALCGGFLSWSTAHRLRALGVDAGALGAHPIGQVRLFAKGHDAQARLPQRCWSLSRYSLDTALLASAQDAGAQLRRGAKVVGMTGQEVELAGGEVLSGTATILATGKHELRGAGRAAPSENTALGLRWRLPHSARLQALVGDAVELHLFAGGYAGLAIQEDGTANLCMAVKRSVLAAAGGDPASLLAQLGAAHRALADRLDAAGGDPGTAQAVANVPYGWIAAQPVHGALRVGDQGAVIPSLAGEGIAIALASGRAAGEAVLQGMDAARFQRQLAASARAPVRVAGAIAAMASRPLGAQTITRAVGVMPWLSGLAARASRIG